MHTSALLHTFAASGFLILSLENGGARSAMDYSTPNPTEIYDSLLQEYDSVFSASRCLAAGFESAAQSAWAQLGEPKSKAGFMKFGDADEGLLSVYPGVKYCDMSEGSHFAPWFVYGASGPKYVVILLDKSSSMYGIGNRWREVEKAAVRIINGLTENDFATVMAFDTQVLF